jgi:hypothetical protein
MSGTAGRTTSHAGHIRLTLPSQPGQDRRGHAAGQTFEVATRTRGAEVVTGVACGHEYSNGDSNSSDQPLAAATASTAPRLRAAR